MINCYVIGDISSVELLCEYINNSPQTSLKGFNFTPPENFSPLFSLKPEIVFLDAKFLVGNQSFLSRIRQFSSLIILSDDTTRAFEAFEHQAFDYLLKPLPLERFLRSINKFHHLSELSTGLRDVVKQKITDSFFIKADSKGLKEIQIKCDNLLYVEALQNYVILHMDNGINYTCYNTMKEMEDGLPETEFSRIHKSFIINDSKISSIEGNSVSLAGDGSNKIIIGNTYKKAFLEKKNQRLIKRERQPIQILRPPKIALSLFMLSIVVIRWSEYLVADFFS